MGKNIVEKILHIHLRKGEYEPGKEIGIKIDQTLVQDATGTMAFLQFEALGLSKVKTDISVVYIDHNTVQIGYENNDDHIYLQDIANKFGIVYSRAGNGICHQVHLERFGVPGTTLLGSDSHTTTGGGMGQIAIGAGGLDVAIAMGGGCFYTLCPKVYKINLTGKLPPWVSAKDVALKMLSIFSTMGNVGVAIEYGGVGVKSLSVPQRATITNMGAEMGVTTSVFPSDHITQQFLRAQKREVDWCEIKADEDANYDKIIDLDLSTLEPMVACPHSPGKVKTIREIAGTRVDQVCIGSCTNSSFRDLTIAGLILKDKNIAKNLSLGVAPGSRQVLQMILQNGAMVNMINAGARLLESACGFCIGNHFSPKSAGVSLRTSNRNFEGRSGTGDAEIYLVSPEIAALSAIFGEITSPDSTDIICPDIDEPNHFMVDDSMFIFPDMDNHYFKVSRGPNIGNPPENDVFPLNVKGEVMLKLGGNITTDHIMPAGPRLKYRSNIEKYSEYVFEHVDGTFSSRCLENKKREFITSLWQKKVMVKGQAVSMPLFVQCSFLLKLFW